MLAARPDAATEGSFGNSQLGTAAKARVSSAEAALSGAIAAATAARPKDPDTLDGDSDDDVSYLASLGKRRPKSAPPRRDWGGGPSFSLATVGGTEFVADDGKERTQGIVRRPLSAHVAARAAGAPSTTPVAVDARMRVTNALATAADPGFVANLSSRRKAIITDGRPPVASGTASTHTKPPGTSPIARRRGRPQSAAPLRHSMSAAEWQPSEAGPRLDNFTGGARQLEAAGGGRAAVNARRRRRPGSAAAATPRGGKGVRAAARGDDVEASGAFNSFVSLSSSPTALGASSASALSLGVEFAIRSGSSKPQVSVGEDAPTPSDTPINVDSGGANIRPSSASRTRKTRGKAKKVQAASRRGVKVRGRSRSRDGRAEFPGQAWTPRSLEQASATSPLRAVRT